MRYPIPRERALTTAAVAFLAANLLHGADHITQHLAGVDTVVKAGGSPVTLAAVAVLFGAFILGLVGALELRSSARNRRMTAPANPPSPFIPSRARMTTGVERSERRRPPGVRLPPGQHAVAEFPRFGTHLHDPPPEIPDDPAIEIAGAVTEPFGMSLVELVKLPRHEITADFHCVSGWSATGLRWEGVALERFYRRIIEPNLRGDEPVTHLVFAGLDGYRSIATLEDALADDVLLAENLNGRPLDSDHGAPLRLVSPGQYGFISTKHLCRIEVHTAPPDENYGYANTLGRIGLRGPLFQRHPRSRVWQEERHSYLPGWSLRPIYRLLIPPIKALSARGSRRQPERGNPA